MSLCEFFVLSLEPVSSGLIPLVAIIASLRRMSSAILREGAACRRTGRVF